MTSKVYTTIILFCSSPVFLVDPHEYHMDREIYVMICVRLAGQHSKNFNSGHHMQTVQSNFLVCIADSLIGTIYFYHFIPLSLALTLPGGHKVSAKQNRLA